MAEPSNPTQTLPQAPINRRQAIAVIGQGATVAVGAAVWATVGPAAWQGALFLPSQPLRLVFTVPGSTLVNSPVR